jgi:hypothetical protein
VYQVELKALPAFLGNRSLHGDIIPADYIPHIRIMAEFVVSISESEAQNTVAPSNCIVFTDHVRSLIRMVKFELETTSLLNIHTVLPNYLPLSPTRPKGAPNISLFLCARSSWISRTGQPSLTRRLSCRICTSRPRHVALYLTATKVGLLNLFLVARSVLVRAFGVIRSKTRTDFPTLILSIMTMCSFSMASPPSPT